MMGSVNRPLFDYPKLKGIRHLVHYVLRDLFFSSLGVLHCSQQYITYDTAVSIKVRRITEQHFGGPMTIRRLLMTLQSWTRKETNMRRLKLSDKLNKGRESVTNAPPILNCLAYRSTSWHVTIFTDNDANQKGESNHCFGIIRRHDVSTSI